MERESIKPSLSSMISIFEKSGFDLKRKTYELLWRFHRQVHEKSDELDLTRIKSFENMVVKHYVDCAYVPKLIRLPSPLLDIGSGAGFPGIPIKILVPRVHIILAEGRKKRAIFLEEVCELLKLDGMEVYPHKIPGRFERPIEGVITRALEPILRTLERVSSLLPDNGKAIFMKGPNCKEEVEEARKTWNGTFVLQKDISYSLPGTPHKRHLIMFTKKKPVYVQGVDISAKSERTKRTEPRPGFNLCGQVKEIVSPNNPLFKKFVKSLKTRGIRKQGIALLSGARQVREVLEEFRETCAGIVYSDPDTIPEVGGFGRIPCYRLHRDLFRQLDVHETGQAMLVVKVPSFGQWRDEKWPPGCTLFVPFQDPRNVGAVIRSAAAFGVSRIVLLKEAAHPYHHASLRAAGSTVWRTEILEGPSINELNVVGVPMVTLSPRGKDLGSYQFPQSFCLVPGLEGPGLPKGLKKAECLSIPMVQGVESLNAAMATGIALYAWRTQKTQYSP
ncbi:MAG: 16S rRNA (guanine(527)-N(7))-methyltransferase RsmG [Deltaproteobacteria bacterium]|nr:16S rRNA (guanine(527)-N(7))-methyltransferase RsmG [Deltaproteobacteria bacterium]